MAKYFSSISSKGQVTVPQEIRNRIGVSPGDRIEFLVENGHTVIRPVREKTNPFARYKGALKAFRSRREITAWIEELRDDSASRKRRG